VSDQVLSIHDLKLHYKARGRSSKNSKVYAVDGVSFHIESGETLSIVGESGCGKSSVARAVLRLVKPTSGEVHLNGMRIDNLSEAEIRKQRRSIQGVFQDPFSSLNPKMRIADIIAEPIRNFALASSRADLQGRIEQALEKVRLPLGAANKFPHEFSGGQRQRIGIARALAAEPEIIVCDEAVSALDVSVKAQIVNLLIDLQRDFNLALLFISHDLAIVEHMTHRVAVMYLGKIVEIGSRRAIFSQPQHPYTQALLSAVPVPVPGALTNRIILNGDIPDPMNPPPGCAFHGRCRYAFDRCRTETPLLRERGEQQLSACHLETVPAGKQQDAIQREPAAM